MLELYLDIIHAAIWAIAIIFLMSGLDEIIFDAAFVAWKIYYRFVLVRDKPRLRLATLKAKKEQTIAIMVPAWQESAVIADMIRHAVREIDYRDYMIFVGVYPNDPETGRAIAALIPEFGDHLCIAPVSHDGPTTKSDCLNAIIAQTRRWEQKQGKTVDIYVLHDAEDYVPRYGLRVFNFLMPTKAIVQLPVFPLDVRWNSFTEGHYLDEFAQVHVKDLRVREWLTGGVPSAGVGTGFSRQAIEMAWSQSVGGAFREDLLTEDYEIAMQLLRRGARSAFFDGIVRDAEEAPASMRLWAMRGVPAVRGAFPDRFWSAVRQKTRWTLGITLQGWEDLGWEGTFLQKYLYFRDRKPLFTNLANVGAYFIFLCWLVPLIIDALFFDGRNMPPLYESGSLLHNLILLNLTILVAFMLVRALCTLVIFGPVHALLSFPRLVWGNFINFIATLRAIHQFVEARRKGERRIPWEKTAHSSHQVHASKV